MLNLKKKEGGWILRWVIVIFTIILILSYLGFDIRKFMNSTTTTNNLQYVGEFLFNFWIKYLKPLYDFIANMSAPLVEGILNFLIKIGNGGVIGTR